jgi:hypothetical protein
LDSDELDVKLDVERPETAGLQMARSLPEVL